jgi:hypothetical protein
VKMFYRRQEVDCVLRLAGLKSFTCVQCKFSQRYSNQTAPISMVHWDKHLKEIGSVLQQHGLPCHTVPPGQCQTNMQNLHKSTKQVHNYAYCVQLFMAF